MEKMNMFLELSHEEVDALTRALDVRLHELRMELARADDRAYKRDLRQELESLERIDKILKGPTRSKAA